MNKLTVVNLSLFVIGSTFILWPIAPRIIRRISVCYNYLPVNVIFAVMAIRRAIHDRIPLQLAIDEEFKHSVKTWGRLEMMAFNCISFLLYQTFILLR